MNHQARESNLCPLQEQPAALLTSPGPRIPLHQLQAGRELIGTSLQRDTPALHSIRPNSLCYPQARTCCTGATPHSGAAGRGRGRWRGGSGTRSTFPSLQPRWPRPRSAHLWKAALQPARPVAAPVPGRARCRARPPAPSLPAPPRPAAAELCQVCEEVARTGRGHGEPPPPPARDSEPAPRSGRAGLLRLRAWRSPGGGRSAGTESPALRGRSSCVRIPWRLRSPRHARRPAGS